MAACCNAKNWWQLKASRCSTFVTTWHTFEDLTKTLVANSCYLRSQEEASDDMPIYHRVVILLWCSINSASSLLMCTHILNTYFPSQVFLRAHNNRFSCKIISGQYGCDEDLPFRLPERDTNSSDQTTQLGSGLWSNNSSKQLKTTRTKRIELHTTVPILPESSQQFY